MKENIRIEPPDEMSQRDKIAVLCGQLTVILRRAESGIPVSVESIRRAEALARCLKSWEMAA